MIRGSFVQPTVVIVSGSLVLSGCSLRVAPSMVLFGAYFPAWILLGVIALIVAGATRAALLVSGLADEVPLPLFVCAAVGLVFAGFTVPLYDGGRRAAVLKQAEADADNAAIALERTRDEATRQVLLAANTSRPSLAAYQASLALVDAADTTFDAALQAYRNGVGSVTDATIAETQSLQAKNARTDAYNAALAAAATLAFAAGTLGSAPQ